MPVALMAFELLVNRLSFRGSHMPFVICYGLVYLAFAMYYWRATGVLLLLSGLHHGICTAGVSCFACGDDRLLLPCDVRRVSAEDRGQEGSKEALKTA
eukprot:scaffold7339_cov249-Pinguiococcus_pyrenoidosus.AAC.27